MQVVTDPDGSTLAGIPDMTSLWRIRILQYSKA